jgi:hypothetical protein
LTVQRPTDPVALRKKQIEIARRRRRQAERISRMTVEQRAKYDRWLESHKPGPKSVRVRARQEREAQALFARPSPAPIDPRIEVLKAALAEIRDQRARLEAALVGRSSADERNPAPAGADGQTKSGTRPEGNFESELNEGPARLQQHQERDHGD